MKTTFYSHSFGCRVNQAEKEELDRQLMARGYEYKDEKPDIYIINTCSVTNKAEREAKQLIYQTRKKFPDTKIVVMGCAATNWIKTRTDVEGVDMMVENSHKEFVAELIAKRIIDNNVEKVQKIGRSVASDDPTIDISNTSDLIPSLPLTDSDLLTTHYELPAMTLHDKFTKSGRLIVKIQDGCQRFCTYCIVPYLRGMPKSTSTADIVANINRFDDRIKEAIITAINTEAYGYDTKESFFDLVTTVLEQTQVSRISFGSVHPWSVNEQFFNIYKNHPQAHRMVDFFHIPLQSGSNKMLQLMKRQYTREEFLEKLDILAKIKPHVFIGTDVIVGYLDETDKDFEDTYDFLERTPISKMHIFRFSQRQHTAAFYMAKRLKEPTPQEKQKRAKALADLNTKKYGKFLQTHVGHTFETLLLEKREGDLQHGLLHNQIPVKVKSDKNRVGELHNVKIFDLQNGELFGKIT